MEENASSPDTLSFTVKALSDGVASFYFETVDRSARSETVTVSVETPPRTSAVYDRTVYTTPHGKKYHYSSSCAGINATPTTESIAKESYAPCKTCAAQ